VLITALATLLSLPACHRDPLIDTSPPPIPSDGTISGTVRGPGSTGSGHSRTVEVVNVTTGERQRTATNDAGAFSVKVKPGTYRVELTLRDGETIVKRPGVISVNRPDVDAHADFVVRSAVARPRYRAPRADDGLGSGIA
jgi:hypothetical protein